MDNIGGVILYAGSSSDSSSPGPGSPSSGYQTLSPRSQASSPAEVTFTEIGALKHRGGGGSPRLVFQFPEGGGRGVAPAEVRHSECRQHQRWEHWDQQQLQPPAQQQQPQQTGHQQALRHSQHPHQ
ncbi:nuclear receptor subfamily 1 group D member 1-like [Huso huso]|uniref:Nuclear receptor subfamily 1 group D member 1-like n=1 Tax=Huso huso TaxID=61971 RepID=A0ABR0Y2C5_HUSHU